MKTILFDMDEVLADLEPAWLKLYNETYNDNRTIESWNSWNKHTVVKPECGTLVYNLLKVPGLFHNLEPRANSQEVVQRLVDFGYDIVFVSDSPEGDNYEDHLANPSRFGNPADDKRAWLSKFFPMVPKKNVIFTSQKWRVEGDCLVDDKPETFHIFRERNRNVILMDQSYNQHIDTIYRAKNMLEAEQMIYNMFM
jgi:5'-nucleotidase